MLRRSILVIFVLAIAATFCYAAQDQPAQEQKPEQQTVQPLEQPTTPAPETKELAGIVDKIDMKKNTISIKDETTKENTEYTFNDTTTFSREDKSVKAADFKKGDRVALAVNSDNLILNMKTLPKESEPKLPESEQKEKKH